jgi:trehalose utilization protein
MKIIQRIKNLYKWSAIEPKTPLTAFSGIDTMPEIPKRQPQAMIIKRKLKSIEEEVDDILK